MDKRNRHTHDYICQLCEEKAATLCNELKPVWAAIKVEFPAAHISWAWRDQASQDLFYSMERSAVRWPHSRHNMMRAGVPAAEAFDLFELRKDFVPVWRKEWFRQVAAFCEKADFPIEWGGEWKRLQDAPHYQLKRAIKPATV